MSKLRDMKKRFLPLSMLLITMVLAQASMVANATEFQGKYNPRKGSEATFSSFMKSIRANQETGLIDPALLIEGLKAAQSTAKDANLTWNYAGPDNFGGLTRAIIYNTDGTVLIGTMGGDVYKTTNGGITFRRITNLTLPISCMIANSNGDIFIGTGDGREAHGLNGLSELGYETSFIGKGIYKMAAGSTTPELIEATTPTATNGWGFVNEMTIANGKIYAATAGGIMVSNDETGTSWTNVQEGVFRSIKSNNYGDLLAADDQDVYLSKAGADFQKITGSSYLPNKTTPKVIAMSPSDRNFMYIAYLNVSNTGVYSGGNIYFTNDNGDTWGIAMAETTLYPIFGDDANADGFMIVYPNNPRKLLIGSDDLWVMEDATGSGVNSYRPVKISQYYTYEYIAVAWNRYIYLHQGIQNIVFNPSNPDVFFIGTNGGIYKGEYYESIYSYKSGNRYFITEDEHTSVTRMMSVGISGDTKVIGGSLDHGTIKIEGDENADNTTTGVAVFPNPNPSTNANQQFGFFRKDYAGGPCAISTFNPDILFVSATGALSTPLYRSESNGEDYDLTNFLGGSEAVVTNANAFRTPFALFENYNDANNPVDSLFAPIREIKYKGDMVYAYSLQAGYPVDHIITEEPIHDAAHMDTVGNYVWIPGDTIRDIHDPYSSLFVCGVEGKIYMTREALRFNKTTEWIKISDIEGLPTSVAISGDGDIAMVGTAQGTLYRVSGLANAYSAAQACVDSAACVVVCDSLNTFSNQAVTSISIDPRDNNHVVVTLGNYGNDSYVYRSTNGGDSFTSIHSSSLPKVPVYSCLIEKSDSGVILIGTEYGIYVTDNNGSTWTKSGEVSSPVMDIKQMVQENHDTKTDVLYDEMGVPTYINYPGVFNEGMIYAATYGSGIISCSTYKESGDLGIGENEMTSNVQLNIYPNPVRGNAQVNIKLTENANVSYQIYDLSGRLVASSNLGFHVQGEHTVKFNAENLASGSYIIRLQAGKKTETGKFLVY